jgi:hypothetical protein
MIAPVSSTTAKGLLPVSIDPTPGNNSQKVEIFEPEAFPCEGQRAIL